MMTVFLRVKIFSLTDKLVTENGKIMEIAHITIFYHINEKSSENDLFCKECFDEKNSVLFANILMRCSYPVILKQCPNIAQQCHLR